MVAAPDEQQRRFLTVLQELRRNPLDSEALEIDEATDWGTGSAIVADLEGFVVRYHVAEPYIVLITTIWV